MCGSVAWLATGWSLFLQAESVSVFVSWDITRSTSLLVYGLYRMDILLHFGWVFKPVTCAGLTCSFRSGGRLSKAVPSRERQIAILIILESLWER